MTTIHIQNLTINLSNGGAAVGLPGLLGMILSRAAEDTPATGGNTEGTGETSPTAADEFPQADVLGFLRSDERFEYRTEESIRKHFGDQADVAMDVLDNLVDAGHVTTKRRRSDGVTLYKAVAEAAPVSQSPLAASLAAASASTTAPELTETNVRSFLGSDERYTKRSLDAIAKHFGVIDSEKPNLIEMLNEMEVAGDIESSTRRSDGAILYQLA